MLIASAMQQYYHFHLIDNKNTYLDSILKRSYKYYYSSRFICFSNSRYNYIYRPFQTIPKSFHHHTQPNHFSFRSFYWTMEAMKRIDGAKYECLLFDLDDTLYPMSSGLNMACRKNIEEFMLHRMGINESEVPRMCLELYKEYGTTMAGLKAVGYEFDDDEYHAYAHGKLPYEVLKPDPVLRNLLLSMPQRKIIFTNADKEHAAKVLHRLGLEDCFDGIICFETLNPPVLEPSRSILGGNYGYLPMESSVDFMTGIDDIISMTNKEDQESNNNKKKQKVLCKPSVLAMEAAIQIADLDPNKTLFFDDSVRNIASAKSAGLCTVIVGRSDLVAGADYALSSIHNIKEAVPGIWEDAEREYLEQIIQSTVETVVLA